MLGFACTVSALLGYGLMTLSPIENAQLTPESVAAFVHSEGRVIVGGLITGPLFGWLGSRWRTERAWIGALVAALAVCLEPLARVSFGEAIRFRSVWIGELAVGLVMVIYVAAKARVAQARARHDAT